MTARLNLPFSGRLLNANRERKGFTKRALSRRCRELGQPVSTMHLLRLEKDENRPSPPLLVTLAEALGISVDDLLDQSRVAS